MWGNPTLIPPFLAPAAKTLLAVPSTLQGGDTGASETPPCWRNPGRGTPSRAPPGGRGERPRGWTPRVPIARSAPQRLPAEVWLDVSGLSWKIRPHKGREAPSELLVVKDSAHPPSRIPTAVQLEYGKNTMINMARTSGQVWIMGEVFAVQEARW